MRVTAGLLLRKLASIVVFAFEVTCTAAIPSLFVLLYTFLICYVTILGASWELGVFVWLIPVAFLSPVIYVWYRILEQRYRAYLALLMSSQPVEWNIDAAIEGWLSLTRAKRREKKR